MAKIRFNLKRLYAKNETLICLIMNYDNERLKLSTGISINPKQWNSKQQRAKELMLFSNHREINLKLETQSAVLLKVYNEILDRDGFVEKPILKKEFLIAMKSPKTKKRKKKFWDYFEEFINYKKEELGEIKDYNNSLRKHLIATEGRLKRRITLSDIKVFDSPFNLKFKRYLTSEAINSRGEQGLAINTIGKQYKNLKVFMNWCFEKEYVDRFSMKHLKSVTEEVDDVFLTEDELFLLTNLKLTNVTEKIVRDLFLIGCETALRFSDFTRLEKEHIANNEITITTKKTKRKVVIPIFGRLETILKRNNFCLPKFNGNSTDFNKVIRQVCKKAKIISDFIKSRTINRVNIQEARQKWEMVSSHTCRRTFCTLNYLNGVPAITIMGVSGHKNELSFLRYLKIDAKMSADLLRQHYEKKNKI